MRQRFRGHQSELWTSTEEAAANGPPSVKLLMEPNHRRSLEGFVHLVRWADKQGPASKISLFYFIPFHILARYLHFLLSDAGIHSSVSN